MGGADHHHPHSPDPHSMMGSYKQRMLPSAPTSTTGFSSTAAAAALLSAAASSSSVGGSSFGIGSGAAGIPISGTSSYYMTGSGRNLAPESGLSSPPPVYMDSYQYLHQAATAAAAAINRQKFIDSTDELTNRFRYIFSIFLQQRRPLLLCIRLKVGHIGLIQMFFFVFTFLSLSLNTPFLK